MSRQARLADMVNIIVSRGSVRVEDLTEQLQISPATVRRDLDALADQQLITRTRGGARANSATGELPMRYRTPLQAREKGRIAQEVVSRIEPGQIIAFNGGTTTTTVAFEVGIKVAADQRFHTGSLTVVTNAINIANDLIVRPQLRIVVTGGVALACSYELTGPLAGAILPNINIDCLYLGASAVSADNGICTHNEDEAAINAALITRAKRTVILADSTKLGQSAFAKICNLSDIDELITNTGAHCDQVQQLRDIGTLVTLV